MRLFMSISNLSEIFAILTMNVFTKKYHVQYVNSKIFNANGHLSDSAINICRR